jgi:DNA mismatch endonuclease (patch repair protein)
MADYELGKTIKVPRFEKKNGFYTTSQRSLLMSKIKGKNTSPEIRFRKTLWDLGLRYRLHNKKLPGNPDIVFKKHKLIIFIDCEFWHGYNWEQKKIKIKANRDFWIPKIERNIQRDNLNNIKLEEMGYKVYRFWEQDIKKNLENSVNKIIKHIQEKSAGLI